MSIVKVNSKRFIFIMFKKKQFTFVEIFAIKSEEFRKCIIYKRCHRFPTNRDIMFFVDE